jgi:Zn-finger nucleic acid-binding protein
MTDRQGIEIDYCPTCRGVWLDRGELDKLIERSTQPQAGGLGTPTRRQDHRGDFENSDLRHGEHGHGQPVQERQHGQRPSFWRELFD